MPAVAAFVQRNFAPIWSTYFRARRSLGVLEPPETVAWQVTDHCNFFCEHCIVSSGPRRPGDLGTEEALDLMDQLADLGVKTLNVTGGEPFLRRDLFTILRRARDRGLAVTINSNGSLIPKFESQLREIAPDGVMISLDGLPRTHDAFRRAPGSFQKCIAALELLRRMKVSQLLVSTTVQPGNLHELDELFFHIALAGANQWQLEYPIPQGRASGKAWLSLDRPHAHWLRDWVIRKRRTFDVTLGESFGFCGPGGDELRNERYFCGSGWNTFSIRPNGDVIGCFCCPAAEREGSVRRQSLAELWSERFRGYRDGPPEGQPRCCALTQSCALSCPGLKRAGKACYRELWE